MKHIRIISPSGVIDPTYIDGAAERLRTWGFLVSEGNHTRDTWGRFAGTDEDRLADLIEALNDDSVDFILCSRGGYGLQRIIDRVPPITKPVIGFSDITALHQAAGINGCSSLHDIMCKHIATLPEDSEPLLALRQALAGEKLEYSWPSHPLNRPGEACAPVVGGNLSVLYGLQGTRFGLQNTEFRIQFPILLIEDIGERHYHIDRMMRNLRMSGVLAHLSGLIVGQFSDCEADSSMLTSHSNNGLASHSATVYDTINEAVADYDYPVIFNAPVGHVEHNMPIWLNKSARMEVTPSAARLVF